jgi:hypothetical protein
MLTDYRTMLAGMAGVHAAAMSTAVTTTARFAELILREAELTTGALLGALAPSQAAEQGTWENALASVCERQAEFFHECAGLPRFSLLVFLGELDRGRGRRPIPPTDAD